MRSITKAEATFSFEVESEDMPVRGNAICSDDPVFDKQVEDEIIARLGRGDYTAWCCIAVKAKWGRFTGVAYLGGCSFAENEDPSSIMKEYDLEDQALDDLNATLASAVSEAKNLLKELGE